MLSPQPQHFPWLDRCTSFRGVGLVIPKDIVASDGVAQSTAEENIGWEVSPQSNPREANRSRQTVGGPGDPAMIAVAARNDRSDGDGRDCMSRRKAATYAGFRVEESVRIISWGSDVGGAPPGRYAIHDRPDDFGIRYSFRGEERGFLHVRIAARKADDIDCAGNGDCFHPGDFAAEYAIEAPENSRVGEIRLDARVGGEKCEGAGSDGNRWSPILSLRELVRERPHLFLIVQEVSGQEAQGDVALCGR
jgi:hypothetical protein